MTDIEFEKNITAIWHDLDKKNKLIRKAMVKLVEDLKKNIIERITIETLEQNIIPLDMIVEYPQKYLDSRVVGSLLDFHMKKELNDICQPFSINIIDVCLGIDNAFWRIIGYLDKNECLKGSVSEKDEFRQALLAKLEMVTKEREEGSKVDRAIDMIARHIQKEILKNMNISNYQTEIPIEVLIDNLSLYFGPKEFLLEEEMFNRLKKQCAKLFIDIDLKQKSPLVIEGTFRIIDYLISRGKIDEKKYLLQI